MVVFENKKQMREDAIRMHTHRETKEKNLLRGSAFIFPSLIRGQRILSDISIIKNSHYRKIIIEKNIEKNRYREIIY